MGSPSSWDYPVLRGDALLGLPGREKQAGGPVTLFGRRRPGQRGILHRAPLDRDRAPRVEAAAGRDGDGVGRLALQDLRTLPIAGVAPRYHREQRLRVGVLRGPPHLLR